MAVPSCCSLIDPLYWKYVDLNTKSKRSAISTGVSVVRSEAYSPRSDPHPEMIPNPEMIPKSTLK